MDRRDFLRPSSLWKLANASAAKQEVEENPQRRGGAVVSFRQESMACIFEFQIPAEETNRDAVFEALALVDDIESKLSIYREDSEISRVNQSSAGQWTVVSPDTARLLFDCVELCKLSEGAFDITAGPLLDAWGISVREGRVPSDSEIADCLLRVGSQKLVIDLDRSAVRFDVPDMKLNLGAIGKGYALDRAREFLHGKGVRAALLSAGHSSIVALGRPAWDLAWRIEMQNPLASSTAIGQALLDDSAMSTTGISEQHYEVAGKRFSHILDPRTGKPADGTIVQATYVAQSAAFSEALSTACFIHELPWIQAFVSSRSDSAAILENAGSPSLPKLTVFGKSDIFNWK